VAASGKSFRRVLLIGPAHYVPVTGIAASSAEAFATPLGEIPVDTVAIDALKRPRLVQSDDTAHAPEHALEVELPFLQKTLAAFSIVPLLVGSAAPQHVAQVIRSLIDDQTLLVVSTDLSHYLDDAAARQRDLATAEAIESLDYGRLGPQDACGFTALNGALCAAGENGWTITRLALRNSSETSGDYDRVVGYGAWTLSAAMAS
jgi:AmmeMemoRadiSam system protein B